MTTGSKWMGPGGAASALAAIAALGVDVVRASAAPKPGPSGRARRHGEGRHFVRYAPPARPRTWPVRKFKAGPLPPWHPLMRRIAAWERRHKSGRATGPLSRKPR